MQVISHNAPAAKHNAPAAQQFSGAAAAKGLAQKGMQKGLQAGKAAVGKMGNPIQKKGVGGNFSRLG